MNKICVYGLLLGDKGPRLILTQVLNNDTQENHIEIARKFNTGAFVAIVLTYGEDGITAYTAADFRR